MFGKDTEPKGEYDGPRPGPESSWSGLARTSFIATVGILVGVWQAQSLADVGVVEYWNNTVVPTAETTYDTVVDQVSEHPWQWGIKGLLALIGSGMFIKFVSKRLLGESEEAKKKQKWVVRIVGWLRSLSRNI